MNSHFNSSKGIFNLLRQHKELKDKVMPEYVQRLLDLNNQFSSTLNNLPLTYKEINKIQEVNFYSKIWNSFSESPVSPINTSPVAPINTSPLSSFPIFSKFLYKDFDFSDFILVDEEEAVEEIKHIQVNESVSIKRIITDVYNDNSILLKISPREFEEMVAEILRSKGLEVQLTGQTRDGGFDILAIEKNGPLGILKYLVECKRFKTQKVGVEIIRSFKEVIAEENANKGILVTTSYFTKGAEQKKRKQPYLLDFRDKENILDWVKEYEIKKQ